MKKVFRWLHLWLSVPFGLIITVICFSGAALVFEDEVTAFCQREPYAVKTVKATPLSTPGLASKVVSTSPDGVGVKGKKERLPFFRTVFKLHRWLLDSKKPGDGIFWGRIVVGTSTLMLVFVLLSGLVIGWPRNRKVLKRSLTIHVRKGWRRFCYDLHLSVGLCTVVLLLAMALTGPTWSFSWYRTGFYNLLGVETLQAGERTASVQAGTAEAKYKDADGAKKIRNWVYKIHVGSWGGMFTRILTFSAALLGGTLPLTGYYLWIRRLRRKGQSIPPER